MGRKRTADKYASRSIDIVNYPFLAIPLAELVPDLRFPGKKRRVQEIASIIDTRGMFYLEDFTRNLRRQLGSHIRNRFDEETHYDNQNGSYPGQWSTTP
jgi:hypothetical protein